jgi:hypothetical protein
LKFIGLYSLNQNSEWILINLIIKNSKEWKDFWIILSEIMRQLIHWLSKRIISGNWQMNLQKRILTESISSRLKVKRLNIVQTWGCWRWLIILNKLSPKND